jgi:hypothetical protein
MFMSSAKRTDIQRYDARARNMERGQGNGRGVINRGPQTPTPDTSSDEEISLLTPVTPDKKETKNPVVFMYRRQLVRGAKISHEEWDTIQFKFEPDLKDLITLVEDQDQPGWNWEDKYACDTRVEGTFFEVNVPKKKEGPTKFGDAIKGLATPQAVPNKTTREEDELSDDSSYQEEEKGKEYSVELITNF